MMTNTFILYVDSLSEPDGPVPTYLDLLSGQYEKHPNRRREHTRVGSGSRVDPDPRMVMGLYISYFSYKYNMLYHIFYFKVLYDLS